MLSVARAGAIVLMGGALAVAGAPAAERWHENFGAGALDPDRWLRTAAGEVRAHAVEVVPDGGGAGFRLRLAADTRGTSDREVKHVGVVSRCPLILGSDARVTIDLDWGPPANGSYLAGAMVLSPHLTRGDPRATPDWLSVGYVGVPPGHTARLLVRMSAGGIVRTLHDDGWPQQNRHGRRVTLATLELTIRDRSLQLRENDRSIPLAGRTPERFDPLHVYLQLSSHSNYATRAVHFSDLRIIRGTGAGPLRPLPAAPGCTRALAGGDASIRGVPTLTDTPASPPARHADVHRFRPIAGSISLVQSLVIALSHSR